MARLLAGLGVLTLVACTAGSDATADRVTPIADAGSDVAPIDGLSDLGLADAGSDVTADAASDATPDTTPDTDVSPDATPDVFASLCGNGILESGEVCDDGNRRPGDGCNASCDSDETCGNGITDVTEQCDDGNQEAGDGCDPLCRAEQGCGNGILERGEQCDDGNIIAGDGCSPGCAREVFVAVDTDGDGISDFDEGLGVVDTDGDSVPDSLDEDSDDDGILDIDEAGDGDIVTPPRDLDLDGAPDFRDLDSDADTLSDEIEGIADVDLDGRPNAYDLDSDGDYIPDEIELRRDTDGDDIPDYLDVDSDGDTIADRQELFADSDGDGIPNRRDLDSDNDNLPDAREAGDALLATLPIDTDLDGRPDYVDADSDDDGLPDNQELGCEIGLPNALLPDTDADGFDDLTELTLGSNPCVTTTQADFDALTDFYFILPEGQPAQRAPLEFTSDISQADVAIAMDTTFSMDGEIANLRSSFGSIVTQLDAQIADVGFAVSTFDDFPCEGFGQGDDLPFILRQRVTTNVNAAQLQINRIGLHAGGDLPEAGFESLYQLATGAGIRHCNAVVPAFDASENLVEGVADGDIGGVGFRVGSFPVVMHVTDATAHEGSVYGGPAASSDDAIDALTGIRARVVGVASGENPRAQLEDIARRTGASVRACAWGESRPAGCGPEQCCTGIGGAGRATSGGECPLVFDINSDGAGLGSAVVDGITSLARDTAFSITAQTRRDEVEFAASGFDTSCLISGVTPAFAENEGVCAREARIEGDAFLDVTAGSPVFFTVEAINDMCAPALEQARAYTVFIDVVGDGFTVLDTRRVTVIVPPADENPSTLP